MNNVKDITAAQPLLTDAADAALPAELAPRSHPAGGP